MAHAQMGLFELWRMPFRARCAKARALQRLRGLIGLLIDRAGAGWTRTLPASDSHTNIASMQPNICFYLGHTSKQSTAVHLCKVIPAAIVFQIPKY